mmetsp:Transcript_95855/g.293178  ORF Transcript_95855/g.293178 Transcript_95855/m.293178 type:complete len:323 (-) Transcript_95855:72-1040(-)
MRQRAIDGVARHDDPVPLVGRPHLEQLPRCPALHHPRRREDDARSHVGLLAHEPVPLWHVLDILEGPRILTPVCLLLNLLAAHVGVRLEDPQAFCSHGRIVIYRDVAQVRVALPIIFQDQQNLLRPAEREDRQQALPALPHDLVHGVREAPLALLARLVRHDTIRGLHYEHVHAHVRDLGLRQMPVDLPAVIASIQHSNATDVDHEHRGPEHMARAITRELDALVLPLVMEVHQLDAPHGLIDVRRAEDLVLRRDFADAGVVVPQHPAYRPGGVRHEHFALEIRPVDEVRDRPGVVEVEVRDQQHIHLGRVDVVEIRQRAHA